LKHIFVLILLFSSILNAMPAIDIHSNETSLEDFEVEYFVDKTEKMSLQEIKKQKFTQDTSTLSLGIFQDVAWLRFKLHNRTQNKQKLYIHNENAYVANGIDFYEFKDDKLLNSLNILMQDTNSTKKMFGSDAIFTLTLDANQTRTIYIKSTMKAMQYPHFTIYSEMNSKRRVSNNNILLSIFLGMLIALSLYHALLYITTRYREYIYYALYLASAAVWESILSGMLANSFGIYMNSTSEKLLLAILFLPIFLVLFAKSIFETKTNYKIEDKFLNSILILFSINIGISMFNVHIALIIASSLFTYMFIVLFIITYSIMKKGNPFALTFLLANTIFSLFMMITNLYYQGFINYSPFVFNAASIGVILEALILSLLLSYKIKLLQKSEIDKTKELLRHIENSREKDKMLFQQNKLASMGEMIENIAHQWRQPLSQINSSVLLIDDYLEQKKVSSDEVEKELVAIENLTAHMSKTIDSFKNFFEPNKTHTSFSIEKTINCSILIINNAITNNSIDIELKIDANSEYYGLEDELQQVLIILLNNAKDALIEKKIANPKITIAVQKFEELYSIVICDNAGGIKEELVDKIFEPYFTTKHKTQGTGLGLYISKLIIEDNMFGTINLRNSVKGACFIIELPNKKLCII